MLEFFTISLPGTIFLHTVVFPCRTGVSHCIDHLPSADRGEQKTTCRSLGVSGMGYI